MLTIMSSLAQDESRSISENIKWGMRKSFADGKVTVPYSNLLGFDKGPDGVLAINEKEARIVRWIFSRCLMEYPPGYIAKRLREMGVPNVHGNSEWSKQTVRCILRNKKHVGGCHPPEDLFPGFPDKETDSEQRPAHQVLCEERPSCHRHQAAVRRSPEDHVQTRFGYEECHHNGLVRQVHLRRMRSLLRTEGLALD